VEPGTWNLADVYILDNAGNSVTYYQSDLQALGYPTTLQVTSTQDSKPPVLTFFSYGPQSVDVTNGPATVTVTLQATDDLSGVTYANVGWTSPDGKSFVGSSMGLSSGTNLNGTWTAKVTVPQFVEPGTWNLADVYILDNAGNSVTYYQSDLQALGYPTTLQVIDGTSVAQVSGTNPSAYNQPVTFTATVTSGTSTVATGTVNFNDGSTTIGSGTLNASGVATFTTSTLSVGPHSMVAAYLGDANNPPENSQALTQTVNLAASSVAISSSTNPSTVTLPVTLTATVSGAFGGTPTGTVTFKSGGYTLGTATLSNGAGSILYAFQSAGTTSITAIYSGDSNFVGGNSPAFSQVVKKAVTTATMVSSLNPAIVGEQVTFTATFSSSIGPPADGETVTFKDGVVTLATVKMSGGVAAFLTKKLSRGLHNIEARYDGDAQHWGQTAAIVQVIKQR
jgi:hypothetical protein